MLKTFDSTYQELRLSKLTFVSFYKLFVSRACRWYPWTVTKVDGVGMGSDELTIEDGSNDGRRLGPFLSWV